MQPRVAKFFDQRETLGQTVIEQDLTNRSILSTLSVKHSELAIYIYIYIYIYAFFLHQFRFCSRKEQHHSKGGEYIRNSKTQKQTKVVTYSL